MSIIRDNRKLEVGACYHFYNRGNRKEKFAFDDEDYLTYVSILDKSFAKYSQKLIAYSIMPNHYHLEAQISHDTKDMVSAIRYFSSASARYFNVKYSKVGHMFQDKYKHRRVVDDYDLVKLSRYIHRNAIDAELVKDVKTWKWDSCAQYLGLHRNPCCSVDKGLVLKHFKNSSEYQKFLLAKKL